MCVRLRCVRGRSEEWKHDPIGKFGSTDASVGLVRISAWVSAERPSFICDYVQRKKAH